MPSDKQAEPALRILKAPLEQSNITLIVKNIFIFMVMETIIAHPENADKLKAVKAVLKALNVVFETKTEKPYNQEFVEKILQGDEDFKAGKGRKMTLEELDSLWK